MKITLYALLAILPSIIWLLFYLRKDKHPEPNKMVLKIFFFGIISALGALLCEYLYDKFLKYVSLDTIPLIFIGGAVLIEEYLKYLVVKTKVLKNPEFDEPIDAMLYMIIAALGFAAAENLLLFLNAPFMNTMVLDDVLIIALGRFVGAVFLHTLCSGIIGYFLARSLMLKSTSPAGGRERKSFLGLGIIVAACLHGIYNYIIIVVGLSNNTAIWSILILLGIMSIVVSLMFKNLIKIKSFCKI